MAPAALDIEAWRIGSRNAERMAVGCTVGARVGRDRTRVLIDNLSLTGVGIHTQRDRLRPGDDLLLDLSLSAPRKAVVVWTDGVAAGCRLLEPLSPSVLQIVLHALRVKGEGVEATGEAPCPDA